MIWGARNGLAGDVDSPQSLRHTLRIPLRTGARKAEPPACVGQYQDYQAHDQ